ncbi:MAG: hypothetical protein K940chlam3_01749, partial [Chlamydiae bacterium]|nr:hypothetical protein [Chlamydiota bacterium]
MDRESFETNLALFSHNNPQLAIHIPEVSPETPPTYPGGWFSVLPIQNCEVVYLFGIGLGEGYTEGKRWLHEKSERRLIIMEDNLGILHHFLQTESATDLLNDPQVELYGFFKLSEEDPIIKRVGWSVVQQEIYPTSIPFYAETRSQEAEEFEQVILYETTHKNEIVDEYLNYGIVFYRSFYRNLLSLHESYHGNQLFGKFQNIPAIICGAGPSLKKNMHLLKDLSDKALIFGGGSALKALSNGGIIPHFGAGIDPNPSQLDRMEGCPQNLPFFYRPRMHYQAFREVRGPRLYINGAGGYDTAEWFEEQLGISHKVLDEGHNVVNFCTEIAHELGCHPIIFVGMDLAYTGNAAYSEGVVESHEMTHEVTRPDIFGNPVSTQWKWIAESDWLARYVKENSHLTVINATEGGIGFRGVPNVPLKKVIEKYFTKSYPLHEIIPREIEKATMPEVIFEKVLELFHELEKSLEKLLTSFDILIQESEKV